MGRATVALLAILCGCTHSRAPCDLVCRFTLANRAAQEKRYDDYLRHWQSVAELAPTHPSVVYAVARGFALNGRLEESERVLARLAAIGDARDVTTDSAFGRLRGRPQFVAVADRLRGNQAAVVRGNTAVELPDPDHLPEALAYDAARDRFLVGSLAKRKIVALGRDGVSRDFIAAERMLRVVGVHIDTVRSHLWFATWEPRQGAVADTSDRPSVTRLFKADLVTGRILREYAPRDSVFGHLFNDLAIAPNGDVYITDTDHGWLYRVGAAGDTLEVYLRPDASLFASPNGITLSLDGQSLFVGFFQGIARVDLATRRIEPVATPDTVSDVGVDGLYAYKGVLIGVQHLPTLSRVAEFTLSRDGHSIVGSRTLERGIDVLRLPTTGQVVGSRFYYIATSQYDRIDDHNRIAPAATGAPRSRIRVIDLEP